MAVEYVHLITAAIDLAEPMSADATGCYLAVYRLTVPPARGAPGRMWTVRR